MNRIFKSGKPISEKKVEEKVVPTRVQMAQFFGRQFEKNIKSHAAIAQSRWLPRYDQQNLLQESTSFIYSLNSIVELINQLKGKVKKDQRSKMNLAEDQLIKFRNYVHSLNMKGINDTTGYLDALNEVINEARFCIFQFNLVCDCITNDHKPPFRPTDRAKKLEFLKIVIEYEDRKGKFPPCKSRELKHLNLSEKTWGTWKNQIENGTFPNFRQHK